MSRTSVGLVTAAILALLFAGVASARIRPSQESAAPCFDARVVHVKHSETPDGVITDSRFVERFYRCGDRVWVERVLPEPNATTAREREHGDPLLPFANFARDVSRRPGSADDDSIDLRLVNRRERSIVLADEATRQAVGVGTRFDVVAEIVPWSVVSHMRPVARPLNEPAESLEGRTYASNESGRSTRVKWSDSLHVTVDCETVADDGKSSERVFLESVHVRAPGRAPWDDIEGFSQKRSAEVGD